MFSEQLIDQLSLYIIRPHRELYGLDKLGPRKLIVKNHQRGDYMEASRHECTITSEGKKIQLSLFVPQSKPSTAATQQAQDPHLFLGSNKPPSDTPADRPVQVTVFLHTNSGSRLEGLEYCKHLLQHGHVVCLFDYSGSGVSEGEFVSMGLNEARDLANVVKFLQDKFSAQRVNLWGRSMGAVTALLYASKHPSNVGKLVLDSPFCSFKQLLKEIVSSRTGLPDFVFGAVLSRIEANIQSKLGINLMDIDLKNEIVRPGMQRIPICFLISKEDKLVKPIHVETLYELHAGCKKILYLEGSHNKPRPAEVREQCADFICKRMQNVNSQKNLDTTHKKHNLGTLTRKYSEDSTASDIKLKEFTASLHKAPQYSQPLPSLPFPAHNTPLPSTAQYYTESFSLNLNMTRAVTEPSSAQTTPRDREENSLNKYQSSKISLSQLKKSQACFTEQGFSQPGAPCSIRNTIAYKSQIDFKKQVKTTAIQYKNKIKQQINKV